MELRWVRERAAERPEGYYEDVVSRGTIEGEWLTIPDEAYAELIRKYDPGLGDRIASVAGPIAKALDSVLGTNLANCGGCKARRDWANKHL